MAFTRFLHPATRFLVATARMFELELEGRRLPARFLALLPVRRRRAGR